MLFGIRNGIVDKILIRLVVTGPIFSGKCFLFARIPNGHNFDIVLAQKIEQFFYHSGITYIFRQQLIEMFKSDTPFALSYLKKVILDTCQHLPSTPKHYISTQKKA